MFPLLPCKFSLTSMDATFELLSVVPRYLEKSHFQCGKLHLDENTKVNVTYTANSKNSVGVLQRTHVVYLLPLIYCSTLLSWLSTV